MIDCGDIADRLDREILEELYHMIGPSNKTLSDRYTSNPCAEIDLGGYTMCEPNPVRVVKPDGVAPAMPSDSGVHPWPMWSSMRRIWPRMIAQEFIKVQPMSLPSSAVFFMYDNVRTSADRDMEARYHGYSSYADMAAQLGLDSKG